MPISLRQTAAALLTLTLALPALPATAQDLSGFTAEPQTPSGRFLTATEVKPILGATQASWIAVREFNGQDLVYVTQIWSWRCGLLQLELSLNGAPFEVWPLPACHEETASPAAILDGDGDPYRAFPLGSVQTVAVRLVYDDLSVTGAEFPRAMVLMP